MNIVKLDNGRIVLINGNSLEVLRHIKPNSIDLVFADPPYYGVVKDHWDHQWSDLQDHLNWSKVWVQLAIRAMKDSASFYICGGVGEKSDTIVHLYLMIKQLLHFKDWITWKKSRGMGNRRGWVYGREELLWFVKTNKQFVWNDLYQYSDIPRKNDRMTTHGKITLSGGGIAKSPFRRIMNVWEDISEQGNDVLMKNTKHTTPKPQKMLERIINCHTLTSNDTVLDPFLGSGTTGEICVKLNRRFIGIEKDKQSFDEAVWFIQQSLRKRNETTQNVPANGS
jgi:DNA modification methylase